MNKVNIYAAASLFSILMSSSAAAYEEPAYVVVANTSDIEFRQYQPYLVAETTIADEADRSKAASAGFRRLFDYISGDNTVQTEIEMTAPVKQQATSAEIDMTTPVRQVPDASGWKVTFALPREFDQANVPQPTNPDVFIRTEPGQLMAVLQYSGRWTDENVNSHKAELIEKLSAAGLTIESEVITAFYNAPFSLPFMRRNEVMVAVTRIPD